MLNPTESEMAAGRTAFSSLSTGPEVEVTLDEVLARLDTAERYDPVTLKSRDIPRERGIYVWYVKGTANPAYVGKACGRKGLRHRIWAQHLNPNYLEGREQKFSEADAFQLGCAVAVKGQPYIDKSVFWRNLGRRERIAPGKGTVDFIRAHLEVAVVVLPIFRIPRLERELIATFGAQWDLYNLSGNPRAKLRNPLAVIVA